jgi:hypothetical protein
MHRTIFTVAFAATLGTAGLALAQGYNGAPAPDYGYAAPPAYGQPMPAPAVAPPGYYPTDNSNGLHSAGTANRAYPMGQKTN